VSTAAAFTVVIAMLALVAAVALLVHANRPLRLPGTAWFESAGARFARDLTNRQQRYAAARADAEHLATAVAEHLGALVEGSAGDAHGIGSALLRDCEEALRDLFVRLDALECGLAELTVVLYGRDKAGKSSLYYVLSGDGFDGIGAAARTSPARSDGSSSAAST
jgi:hypothetical protein